MIYFDMIISHIVKAFEYYAVEGVNIYPFTIETLQGIIWNFAKIITIYFFSKGA